MRRIALSLAVFASLAPAQDNPFAPAKELQKYAPMLGTWEGSGIVRHTPEGPEEEWTAKSTARWALAGHAVREDTRIYMDSMERPIAFTNYYGWDRERKRHVLIEIGNMGTALVKPIRWSPSGKMISGGGRMFMGQHVVERWVTTLSENENSFFGEEAIDDGPFFRHVEGSMKRVSKEAVEMAPSNEPFMPELVAIAKHNVDKIRGMSGTYQVKGWWIPGPDMPKVEFTGKEVVEPIYGGSILRMHSTGPATDATPAYEGYGWFAWDEEAGCYSMAFANSMGEFGSQHCHLIDNGTKMVAAQAGTQMGQPMAMRGVFMLDDGGRMIGAEGYQMIGANKPLQVFGGSYTRH